MSAVPPDRDDQRRLAAQISAIADVAAADHRDEGVVAGNFGRRSLGREAVRGSEGATDASHAAAITAPALIKRVIRNSRKPVCPFGAIG
jgi:hypothetical protein